MKRLTAISVFFLLMIMLSCKKNNDPASYPIVGTWKFSNQNTVSYSYPSVLTHPVPINISNFTYPTDSLKVAFNIDGNFTFSNFRLPVSYGTYKIIQDSLLVITPDTSGLIKFCYNIPVITGGSGLPPNPPLSLTPFPYTNFQFSSDTIIFKKYNNRDVVFTAYRFTKSNTPIFPSGDTLVLNKITSTFESR